jgi:hypothetical protein
MLSACISFRFGSSYPDGCTIAAEYYKPADTTIETAAIRTSRRLGEFIALLKYSFLWIRVQANCKHTGDYDF